MLPHKLFAQSFSLSNRCLNKQVAFQCRHFALKLEYIPPPVATALAPTIDTTVVRYREHGKASTVLKLEKETVSRDLKANEVLIRMEAAPINPADINMIEGVYGTKPTLPAIAGLEGVGTIIHVGSDVKDFSVDDRVIPTQPGFGTWRSYAVASPDQLMKVDKDIPVHYAACLAVNPSTAYRLLTDFGNLKQGDCIIQNAGNSIVGQAVIQIAKARGIHTISIIRERDMNVNQFDFNRYAAELKSLGGDIVVTDAYARTPDFKRSISNLPKPKIAFNAVGGMSATEIARNLADGGTMVTYGAMSRQPVSIPNSLFIFKDIQLRGFWLTKWISEHSKEEHEGMINELSTMVRNKTMRLYLEAHRLSDFEFALNKHGEKYRNRKVVLELFH